MKLLCLIGLRMGISVYVHHARTKEHTTMGCRSSASRASNQSMKQTNAELSGANAAPLARNVHSADQECGLLIRRPNMRRDTQSRKRRLFGTTPVVRNRWPETTTRKKTDMEKNTKETTDGPAIPSTTLFGHLEAGEQRHAWYLHPGSDPAIVIVSGLKYRDQPDVEWLEEWQFPQEYRNRGIITADELPGKWAPCEPPSREAFICWPNKKASNGELPASH